MPVLRFDPFRDLDRRAEQLLGAPAGSARGPRVLPMVVRRAGYKRVTLRVTTNRGFQYDHLTRIVIRPPL